ncbi:AfsR/SARP family transcriptional regulator [Agrococcus beijingensis]|uniref:AfsR/SARP family transcriptional regulator n=1 Tax=Agrococcus beijingensis TaxID=3068634 RepID=UPI002741ABBE|nr:BTAD domain-containing putative transcriptional regulator [Agrococcus sp. REN33]
MNTRPVDEPARLSVSMIGPLVVRRDGIALGAHLGGPKPRQILEILLLRRGAPVSKDVLIELLWGDRAPKEARSTLESYVSVLRRHLQPARGKSGPLRTTTGGYLIDISLVDLDLARFDSLLRCAQRAEPAVAYPLVVEALALATGPLLGDELRPSWAAEERTRHADDVTAARVLAAESALAIGAHADAADWANQALMDDPLHEGAWTALIVALERSGQCAEGLRAYDRCRQRFDSELGCEPSSALRAAHARLLNATAAGQGELSYAVSALLVLNDQLVRSAEPDFDAEPLEARIGEAVRQAGDVLTAFLRRATQAA